MKSDLWNCIFPMKWIFPFVIFVNWDVNDCPFTSYCPYICMHDMLIQAKLTVDILPELSYALNSCISLWVGESCKYIKLLTVYYAFYGFQNLLSWNFFNWQIWVSVNFTFDPQQRPFHFHGSQLILNINGFKIINSIGTKSAQDYQSFLTGRIC